MSDITEILGDTREGKEYPSGNDAIRAARLEFLLKQVTDTLTEASASIARGELAEHYRRAYSRHRASGVTEMVAHDRAMADLGKPRLLRRKFRARLLTKQDQVQLESLTGGTRMHTAFQLASLKFALFAVAIALSPMAPESPVTWSALVAMSATYAFAAVRLPMRLYSAGYKRISVHAMNISECFDQGLGYCIGLSLVDDVALEITLLPVAVAMFAISLPQTIRLSGKLPRRTSGAI
jgi:hypothetical protein